MGNPLDWKGLKPWPGNMQGTGIYISYMEKWKKAQHLLTNASSGRLSRRKVGRGYLEAMEISRFIQGFETSGP